MNNPTTLKVVIAVLVVALLTSFSFLIYGRWQDLMWQEEVYGLAGYMGSERALHDFRDGKLRLFVIAGERSDDKFSGTNDGPFQIWFPQYFPSVYPNRTRHVNHSTRGAKENLTLEWLLGYEHFVKKRSSPTSD